MQNQKKIWLSFILLSLLLFTATSAQAQGLKLESPEFYETIPELPRARSEIPIRSADLSPMFPDPKSQGQQGSCTGWAIAYATRSYYHAAQTKIKPTTADNIFSPAFQYNHTFWQPGFVDQDCLEDGASLHTGLRHMKNIGAMTLSERPYQADFCRQEDVSSLSLQERKKASKFAINAFFSNSDNSVTAIKQNIAQGHPVIIGVNVPNDWLGLRLESEQVYDYSPSTGYEGGHAMVIVGFDDDKGALKIMNSWGPDWGNGGFIWISYPSYEAIRMGIGNRFIPIYTMDMQPAMIPLQDAAPEPVPDDRDPQWKVEYDYAKQVADIFKTLDVDFIKKENNQILITGRGCANTVGRFVAKIRDFSDNYIIRIHEDPWPVCEMNDALTSMRDDIGLDIKRLVKAPVNSNKPQVRSLLVAYDDDGDEEQREEQFIEENPVLDTEGRPIFKEGDQLTLEVNAPSDHTHVQLFYISSNEGATLVYNGELPDIARGGKRVLSMGKIEDKNLTRIKRLVLTGPDYGVEAFLAFTGTNGFLDTDKFKRNTQNHTFLDMVNKKLISEEASLESYSYGSLALTLLEGEEKVSSGNWLVTPSEYDSMVGSYGDELKLGSVKEIGDKDGPKIDVVSPDINGELSQDSVVLEAAFGPTTGRNVLPDSFSVKYKTAIGWIDVTKRVRKNAVKLDATGVRSSPMSLPAGKHRLKVSIKDSDDREGRVEISVKVKK